jgi:hypothetical protein
VNPQVGTERTGEIQQEAGGPDLGSARAAHCRRADLCEPLSAFLAFARSAAALEERHAQGRIGPRPLGRLRPYHAEHMPRWTRTWAGPIYRHVLDPDGRPVTLRRGNMFGTTTSGLVRAQTEPGWPSVRSTPSRPRRPVSACVSARVTRSAAGRT